MALLASLIGVLIIFEEVSFRSIKNKTFRCIERHMTSSKKKLLQKDQDYLFNEIEKMTPHLFRKLKFLVRSQTEDSLTSALFNGVTVISSLLFSLIAVITSVLSLSNDQAKGSFFIAFLEVIPPLKFVSILLGLMYLQYITGIQRKDRKKNFFNKFLVVIDEVERERDHN